ncbi:plasmid stabilization protein, partial [Streptomyces sp. NPDC057074]
SLPETAPGQGGEDPQGPTYDQLYEEAKRRNVHGRSHMNKSDLRRALGK